MGSVAPKRSSAFTLVEILVVIAIVVLLIALLLGVLAGVRAAARKTACATNLRQIWHGLVAYDQEYCRLPDSEGHKMLSDLPSFVDVLTASQHYPAASFICPSSDVGRRSSYEINFDFLGRPFLKGQPDLILASESGSCVQCQDGSNQGFGHGSTVNHLFFDGHVEALPKSPATAGRSPATPPRPPARR